MKEQKAVGVEPARLSCSERPQSDIRDDIGRGNRELSSMSLEDLWVLFPITVEEYNEEYPLWYADEKGGLMRRMRSVERINHIGSTAVPGLVSKPTIDILLELGEEYDMDAAASKLHECGWTQMSRDEAKRVLILNKGYTPSGFADRVYHLHVRPHGDWDELYFRDYLRERGDAAYEYGALKKELALRFKHDRDAYTAAKSEFIRKHTRMAREYCAGRYLPCHRLI